MLSYIVPFLIAIIVIVFIHELGHFLVARYFGVKVETFSVGFGKKLLSWTDRHGTVWKICAVPLGGYVKFEGDANATSFPSVEQAPATPGNFHTKPVWQRALVVAAGPIANFLLAIVIFAAAFSIVGVPNFKPRIASFTEDSAAQAAGMKAGDLIRAIDGAAIESFGDIQNYVRVRPGQEMLLKIDRNGELLELNVTSKAKEMSDGFGGTIKIGVLGFARDELEPLVYERMTPFKALSEGVDQTWGIITTTLRYVGKMIRGEESSRMIGGPGMLAKGAGDAAQSGFTSFVAFIAFISTSIGLVNLFPIPMLDGGHLVYYAIEALRGKPLGPKAQEWGFRIGVTIVLFLMLFGTTNDILRWVALRS